MIKTPIPLKDEPGYSFDLVVSRNIHKPTTRLNLLKEHTYAHALSVEQLHNNYWLERYREGDREAVWVDLLALGNKVRDPEILPVAVAVARETMRRCLKNVEKIVTSLHQINYPFQSPEEVYLPPEKIS